MPVAATAGPETLIRIRAPSVGSWTTSITCTPNVEIVVPWMTVSPVQFIPGLTCDSGMIGPPCAWAPAADSDSTAAVDRNTWRKLIQKSP